MSFRVTPEFKAKLDRATGQTGRSLMQEIEQRLEASFQDDRRLEDALDLAFGEQLSALLMLLAYTMRDVGMMAHYTNRIASGEIVGPDPQPDWMADAFSYDQVVKAVNSIFRAFRPEGDRLPDYIAAAGDETHSPQNIWYNASRYLVAVADPDRDAADLDTRWSKIREKLGDAVLDRLLRNVGVPDLAERPPRRKREAQPRQSPKRNA